MYCLSYPGSDNDGGRTSQPFCVSSGLSMAYLSFVIVMVASEKLSSHCVNSIN